MSERILVDRAQAGDSSAFEALVREHGGKARHAVRRLVGHPEEVDELYQTALLKAWQALDRFQGASSFGTWLVQIASRTALDHLRRKRRWRTEAQPLLAQACRENERLAAQVGTVLSDPGFGFDAREHIAFCFTCVARTLDAEPQVAVVLRDVVGLSNAEAANAAGVPTGRLRHALADGRAALTERFEGLCALVNKQGVCWQCEGLRAAMPNAKQRGEPAPPLAGDDPEARYEARTALIRALGQRTGVSQALHDLFYRQIDVQEERADGVLDRKAAAQCRPT